MAGEGEDTVESGSSNLGPVGFASEVRRVPVASRAPRGRSAGAPAVGSEGEFEDLPSAAAATAAVGGADFAQRGGSITAAERAALNGQQVPASADPLAADGPSTDEKELDEDGSPVAPAQPPVTNAQGRFPLEGVPGIVELGGEVSEADLAAFRARLGADFPSSIPFAPDGSPSASASGGGDIGEAGTGASDGRGGTVDFPAANPGVVGNAGNADPFALDPFATESVRSYFRGVSIGATQTPDGEFDISRPPVTQFTDVTLPPTARSQPLPVVRPPEAPDEMASLGTLFRWTDPAMLDSMSRVELGAHLNRVRRLTESPDIAAALTAIAATPELWEGVASMVSRAPELGLDAAEAGEFHRLLTPLLSGIMLQPRSQAMFGLAVDRAVSAETGLLRQRIAEGRNFTAELVVGSGWHAATYSLEAQAANPARDAVATESTEHLGGQFAQYAGGVFRLNSRNRPTNISLAHRPGTRGSLNDMGRHAPLQQADVDPKAYADQGTWGSTIAANMLLASRVMVNTELQSLSVEGNRIVATHRYNDSGAFAETRHQRIIAPTGLGEITTGFERSDSVTQDLLAQELSKPLADRRIITSYEAVQLFAQERFPLRGLENVSVIGPKDSGRVNAGVLTGHEMPMGMSVPNLDWVESVTVFGERTSTKNEYSRENRLRYGGVALEMPRTDEDPNYYSRVRPVGDRARTLRYEVNPQTGQPTGRVVVAVGEQGTAVASDLVIVNPGFVDRTNEVLTRLASRRISDPELIRQTIANVDPALLTVTVGTPEGAFIPVGGSDYGAGLTARTALLDLEASGRVAYLDVAATQLRTDFIYADGRVEPATRVLLERETRSRLPELLRTEGALVVGTNGRVFRVENFDVQTQQTTLSLGSTIEGDGDFLPLAPTAVLTAADAVARIGEGVVRAELPEAPAISTLSASMALGQLETLLTTQGATVTSGPEGSRVGSETGFTYRIVAYDPIEARTTYTVDVAGVPAPQVRTLPTEELAQTLRGRSIQSATLPMPELGADDLLRSEPIAKKIRGYEIYLVGPAANLPLSEREKELVPVLEKIGENSAAGFRYTERVEALATMLAQRDISRGRPQLMGAEDSLLAGLSESLTVPQERSQVRRVPLSNTNLPVQVAFDAAAPDRMPLVITPIDLARQSVARWASGLDIGPEVEDLSVTVRVRTDQTESSAEVVRFLSAAIADPQLAAGGLRTDYRRAVEELLRDPLMQLAITRTSEAARESRQAVEIRMMVDEGRVDIGRVSLSAVRSEPRAPRPAPQVDQGGGVEL